MALEADMQGGRKLWGFAIFIQLACSHHTDRKFGTEQAGAGLAGASATGGAAAKGGTGGAADPGGGSNAGAGAAGAHSCVTDLDCASQPHVRAGAPAQCSSGKCSIPQSSCESGFGHCSASELEYCETDLSAPSNCGACGKACPSSAPLCMEGQCLGACSSAKPTTCAGSCVDTKSDPSNCGACGTSCNLPNADATCSNGVCEAPKCKSGYGDCSSAAGCETRLNTLTDCGACNQKCGTANDAASCATGTCSVTCTGQVEACFNGKDDDCDGQSDCADSDCTPGAMCVPTATFSYGTMVTAQEACPASFLGSALALHDGLNQGTGCSSGCGCNPTTTACAPVVLNMYNLSATDTCVTESKVVATYTINQLSSACTPVNIGKTWNSMTWTPATKSNCANTGTTTLAPATWVHNNKFCPVNVAGAGCNAGNVCVPTLTRGNSLLADGDQTCPASFPAKMTVYDGLTDNRTCSCSCQAYGGNCDEVLLWVSSSSSDCSGAVDRLGSYGGGGQCALGVAAWNQMAYTFSGAGSVPTSCVPSNVQSGSIIANGPHTLCTR